MHQQIDIQPQRALLPLSRHPSPSTLTIPKQIHKLRVIELRLQQLIQRHRGRSPRDHHTPHRALDIEDPNLIRADGEIDLIPLPLGISAPAHQHTLLRKVPRAVLEASELGHAPALLELSLVVVLLAERHQEPLLALGLLLQRDHRLLDVVVVALELAVQPLRFLLQRRERRAHVVHFARALETSTVLGPDVERDFVQKVLVLVRPGDAPCAFESEDVFEGGAFELSVTECCDVEKGGPVSVRVRTLLGVSPLLCELVVDEGRPLVFVVGGDGANHYVKQVGAGLYANDIQDAALRLHEERFHCRVWVFGIVQLGIQGQSDFCG